jgi:hypothetical protein
LCVGAELRGVLVPRKLEDSLDAEALRSIAPDAHPASAENRIERAPAVLR